MNQLTVETTRSRTTSLYMSALASMAVEGAHKVVAFIVKVKVLLKVVKSNVGRVKVTNPASHTRKPGMKLMIR